MVSRILHMYEIKNIVFSPSKTMFSVVKRTFFEKRLEPSCVKRLSVHIIENFFEQW